MRNRIDWDDVQVSNDIVQDANATRGESMRKLNWLVSGVVIGFVAAHFVNSTEGGRRFFGRVNRGMEEFSRAFSTGYHDAEAAGRPADSEQALDGQTEQH